MAFSTLLLLYALVSQILFYFVTNASDIRKSYM